MSDVGTDSQRKTLPSSPRVSAGEGVIAAAMALVPWVEEVLAAYEGNPAPNEKDGKRRLVALVAALQAAGEEL